MLRRPRTWALCSLLAVGSASALGAAEWSRPVAAKPAAQTQGLSEWVKTELYFGGTQLGGGLVSDADWSSFLAKVVTPAFPQGLTVYDAYGQIQQANGKIRRQPTRVVVIVHPRQPNREASFSSVIEAYQRQFPGTKAMKLTNGVDQPQFFPR
ncbi:MAG: hypothetical protein RLZZ32_2324 [Cyanobacteriota bacterium]|jgi:hypothetical protein